MTKTHKKRNKRKKGGDIDTRNGLKYILSIGYEIETGTFSKLTKTDVVDDPDDLILYNTDTSRKDILAFRALSENEDAEILDDELISRMEEMVDADAFNDRNEVDKDIIFNITSDISQTPFLRKLEKICDEEMDKNDLYEFKAQDGAEYKIHFIYKDERPCATFSNVEWLFTYMNPEKSPSVVIDTFSNALSNLVRHLGDLETINGNLVINTNQGELIIDDPEVRTLYHKPNTNLYYLDTHVADKEFTIDDLCFTSQMTFSCNVENVLLVMKTLVKDNYNIIPTISDDSSYKLYVLNQIEDALNHLIKKYNEREPTFKLIMTKENTKTCKKMMGYLFLLLFKISRYYNHYLTVPKNKRKYFKNSLFFNARHNNNVLYSEIKKAMMEIFASPLNQKYNGNQDEMNREIANIIQRLIVQEEILTDRFIEETTKVRKNALSPRNILDKTMPRYGDPEFSLISYFHFFENPSDASYNVTDEGKIYSNDWLEAAEIDFHSAKMDLNNDIVLVEFRGFQKLLSNYVFSVADDKLKNMMRNGICNMLAKKYSEDVGALSLGIVKRFLYLQKEKRKRGGKKTRKNRRKHK